MNYLKLLFFVTLAALAVTSCSDDEADMSLQQTSFDYAVHTGQTVPTAPYGGMHATDFTVNMNLEEMENGNTMITMTLNNTMDGETYNMHAHDAADAATTPNGTPYVESPNGEIFAQMAVGNGGTVTVSQEASMSFESLTNDYSGFFVVHDPLQDVSTVDITTYLVVGLFAI